MLRHGEGCFIHIGNTVMVGRFWYICVIHMYTDSSAAEGIASRKGLGKVRHIEVNQVWVQDRVARGDLTIEKVNGKENVADNLTRHVNAEDISVHMHKTNQEIARGRHEIAPEDN